MRRTTAGPGVAHWLTVALTAAPWAALWAGLCAAIWVDSAGHADAADRPQKQRLAGRSGSPTLKARGDRKPAPAPGEATYYEHVLEKVPFGSKRWWDIYEEQHGTPD
jgi:hypothetical protein